MCIREVYNDSLQKDLDTKDLFTAIRLFKGTI